MTLLKTTGAMLPVLVVVLTLCQMLQGSDGGQADVTVAVKAGVTRQPFGKTAEGTAVDIFTLTNRNGVQLQAMTYGGIITSLRVPDRSGTFADVVLGFDTLDPYLE